MAAPDFEISHRLVDEAHIQHVVGVAIDGLAGENAARAENAVRNWFNHLLDAPIGTRTNLDAFLAEDDPLIHSRFERRSEGLVCVTFGRILPTPK